MLPSLVGFKSASRMLLAVAFCGLNQASAAWQEGSQYPNSNSDLLDQLDKFKDNPESRRLSDMIAEPKYAPVKITTSTTTHHKPFAFLNHCPGYDVGKLNDFSHGYDTMTDSGWIFSTRGGTWSAGTRYRPPILGLVTAYPAPTSYWGWDFPGNGVIRLVLNGRGTLSLDVGNAFHIGFVRVGLEPLEEPIGIVPANTLSQLVTHTFEDGYMLTLQEARPRAIIVINHIAFKCDEPCSSQSPDGWCSSGSFCSENHVCEPVKDMDYCLQQAPNWNSTYTCANSKDYCESFAKDMQRCCPHSCGGGALGLGLGNFRKSECEASSGSGTCVYPRPTPGTLGSLDGVWTGENNKQFVISGGTLSTKIGRLPQKNFGISDRTPTAFKITGRFGGGSATYKQVGGVYSEITTANGDVYTQEARTPTQMPTSMAIQTTAKPTGEASQASATTTPPASAPTLAPIPFTPVPPHSHHVCQGYDEEWKICEGPPCDTCKPINCAFGEWQEWFDAGGCSQVSFRQRMIAVSNNECGQPCEGAKIESKRLPKLECTYDKQDCILSDWAEWSSCNSTVSMQSIRVRTVVQEPAFGGEVNCRSCSTCESTVAVTDMAQALKETRACEEEKPPPCEFRAWHDWTICSASCGYGQRTRMRRVGSEAQYPGLACNDVLSQVYACKIADCPQEDCKIAPWSEWSPCLDKHSQSYRNRYVQSPSAGDGSLCVGALQETKPCPKPPVINCTFSIWSEWSTCDRTCDVGQTFRSRALIQEPANGGTCSESVVLKNTKPCQMPACFPDVEPCVFSAWTKWTPCTVKCGQGAISRSRTIASFAKDGGLGCTGMMSEAGSCEGTQCGQEDCKWSDWYEWSACTCTCGGGTKVRSRAIAQAPRMGGALCPNLTKSEMTLCNTQTCSTNTTDAEWGAWSDWGLCSSTCSKGFKTRTRQVAQDATCSGDACGAPLKGTREQYMTCSNLVECLPSQDCILGEWSAWSYCSCSCYGNRERNRVIQQFARGTGVSCTNDALKQFEPCNPGQGQIASPACGEHPKVNCEVTEWTAWSVCSKTCGGGQKEKTRKISQYPKYGGEPCSGDLKIIDGCNEQPCTVVKCQDCKWGDWGDWGDCSHCGGQRFRFRHILELPNHCGQPCEESSAKEVSDCNSTCSAKLACAWSDWSGTSGCQANSCGGSSMRTRTLGLLHGTADAILDPLFMAPDDALCTGTQLFTATCDQSKCQPACEPVNCQFEDWGEWTQQTCLGLCYRSRVIGVHNNQCGLPCAGDLEETKRCDISCNKTVDCTLSEWTDWSLCTGPNGQESRSRFIKTFPLNGGAKCKGVLGSTRSCGISTSNPCELSDWTSWSACSNMCDWGYQTRSRSIMKYASGGGELCTSDLQSLQACKLKDCNGDTADCELSAWSPWSECDVMRLKGRSRLITALASGAGMACRGSVKETASCGMTTRDCEMSEWTKWDACDRSCGGGQQQRHRQIHTFPKNNGKSCPTDQIMQRGCNTQPCSTTNCILSAWTQWSACQGQCGNGQVSRSRVVTQVPSTGGEGCKGPMQETMGCVAGNSTDPSCTSVDCVWDEWSVWSDCTCTCGGGQMNRVRHIKVMPSPGGKACSNEDREVVKPCNTFPCGPGGVPEDGEWGEWSAWAVCSATCKTGVTFRTRKVEKMASLNGQPPYGLDRESKFCNEDVQCSPNVDCLFDAWEDWSACSMTCSGVKRRSRRISRYGKGDGKHCIGALKQTYPCNPSVGEGVPLGCGGQPPIHCVLGIWSSWSICSATCGEGNSLRARKVVTPPAFGGKACEAEGETYASLSQVRQCNMSSCNVPTPVDCTYGDWEDWNACGKCGGQRKRFRHIIVHAQNGGTNCDKFASEELGSCPFYCEKHGHCEWGDWGPFGPCTARCGQGKQMRTRMLKFTPVTIPGRVPNTKKWFNTIKEYSQELEQLNNQSDALKKRSPRTLVYAFGLGFFFVGALMAGFKLYARGRLDARQNDMASNDGSRSARALE